MGALLYLSKRTFINNLKKAVKKPVTLLLMVGIVAYVVLMLYSLGILIKEFHFESLSGFIAIITAWTFYMFIGNFIQYFSRKGVIFRPAHAHFVFPSPISPKAVLLQGAWMNYLLSIIVNLILLIAGLTVFAIPLWKMLLFFMAGTVLDISFEISIMLILYTGERFSRETIQKICMVLKGLLLAMTAVLVFYFYQNGITLSTVSTFVDMPALQMIPAVGWNIAFYRLILLGPGQSNVVCAGLYVVLVMVTFICAWRMKCEGNYYEDAAKFADDYAEMRKRKSNGEMVFGIEKKKKYKIISGEYGATGAKAIFYRQMLEYKKERFFLFDKMTVMCLVLSIIFSRVMRDTVVETRMPQLVLLGVILYMTLLLTGYLGKWENEIQNPYLYLIPDSAVRKLWYATLAAHMKAFVEGCFLCLPMGIAWRISPLQLILAILVFTVLQANKLYTKVLAQCLVGDVLGKKGQDIVRVVMQMFLLGFGMAVAVSVGLLVNADLIFPIVLIYSLFVTVILGLLASLRFDRMEQVL